MKGARITYSADEMAWLEANRMMVISDYHVGFLAAFPRPDVSLQNLHALRKRKGWKIGRTTGRTKGRRRLFSSQEVAWLTANITMETEDWRRAFCEAFDREVTAQQLITLRKNAKIRTGRTGRFARGQTPANKGKRCPEGRGGRHPNACRTQFKAGQEPHNTKFAGHERVNADGYVEISVAAANPYTGYGRRYVHKHVHLWVTANGPVPAGHVLKCLDSDKTNTDPSNWEAIPRGVLPRLTRARSKTRPGYDAAEPELKPALMALAKIQHQIAQRRRQSRDNS